VGGLLAREEYDLRSQTDVCFLNTNDQPIIATEAKTNPAFPERQLWYHKSRGAQVFSALYSRECPTFLYTPKHWKLFLENSSRNSVLTFPYGVDATASAFVNSSLMKPVGTTLLKAICICLLSAKSTPAIESSPTKMFTTPDAKPIHKRLEDSGERLPKKPKLGENSNSGPSSSLEGVGCEKRCPTFVSGYCNGVPVRTQVRVLSDEAVRAIEEEILEKEKSTKLAQSATASG